MKILEQEAMGNRSLFIDIVESIPLQHRQASHIKELVAIADDSLAKHVLTKAVC